MYRLGNHDLVMGNNYIFLPEEAHIKTVKTILNRVVLVTLEPQVWARSSQRSILLVSNYQDVNPEWDYIGSVVSLPDLAGQQEVISIFDTTVKEVI